MRSRRTPTTIRSLTCQNWLSYVALGLYPCCRSKIIRVECHRFVSCEIGCASAAFIITCQALAVWRPVCVVGPGRIIRSRYDGVRRMPRRFFLTCHRHILRCWTPPASRAGPLPELAPRTNSTMWLNYLTTSRTGLIAFSRICCYFSMDRTLLSSWGRYTGRLRDSELCEQFNQFLTDVQVRN
jgi:hypothetical protein